MMTELCAFALWLIGAALVSQASERAVAEPPQSKGGASVVSQVPRSRLGAGSPVSGSRPAEESQGGEDIVPPGLQVKLQFLDSQTLFSAGQQPPRPAQWPWGRRTDPRYPPRWAPKPTHMAWVGVQDVPDLLVDVGPALAATRAAKEFSEEQKHFLDRSALWAVASQNDPAAVTVRRSSDKGYGLYAVSEADARKMAEAFVEWLDLQSRQKIVEAQKRIKEIPAELAAAKQEMEAARGRLEEATREHSGLLKELGVESLERARQVREELTKLGHVLEIDEAGTLAKLEAIRKLWAEQAKRIKEIKEKGGSPVLSSALGDMQAQLDVELAGIMRKREVLRAKEQRFQRLLALSESQKAAETDISNLARRVGHLEHEPSELEGLLVWCYGNRTRMKVDPQVTIAPVQLDAYLSAPLVTTAPSMGAQLPVEPATPRAVAAPPNMPVPPRIERRR